MSLSTWTGLFAHQPKKTRIFTARAVSPEVVGILVLNVLFVTKIRRDNLSLEESTSEARYVKE